MTGVPGLLAGNEHDEALLANVRPSDWVNPQPDGRYNLVVVGAGSAGLISAAVAAGLGARVALVERHLLGGDCLNVGCVPSKSLIRAARLVEESRRAAELGLIEPAHSAVDFAAAMQRMRRLRARISREDAARRYRDELGVDVFLGDATFTGPDRVEVAGAELRFRRAVIATGARPAAPEVPGLAAAGYRNNETIFSLSERPRRLAVIGTGPIGCELAQAFRRLGCDVTAFGRADHLLPREDADAAEIVQQRFVREGIRLVQGCALERVEARGGEKHVVARCADGQSMSLAFDEILVGVGRTPNLEGLGLEAARVAFELGRGVVVDEHLRTSNRRIYAAGDVCLRWQFTHAADAAAKIAVQNALFLPTKKVTSLVMPWCTYTDPEVAHVGLYEHEARAAGTELVTHTIPLEQVNRAVTDGEEEGFVKVHVAAGSDRIAGATIVAAHAGEMISEVTTAMVGGIGLNRLLEVIHPYPTQAEGIKRAAASHARSRLTPRVAGLLRRYMAWRR